MIDDRVTRNQMKDFKLGRPALVCRWRLSGGTLPLENRHLRALGSRTVRGAEVSPHLVAWAKQHIDWKLEPGSTSNTDGVLLLIIDEAGQAAMTVGPYEPLRTQTTSALAERAAASAREAARSTVAPESLWLVCGDRLVWGFGEGEHASGAGSLMSDLAATIGIPVTRTGGLARDVLDGCVDFAEAFLV